MNPMMPTMVGCAFLILLSGLAMRRLGQPSVVAYLLVGVLIGPSGLKLLEGVDGIASVGEIGVVLLLFFAGMELSLPSLVARWRVAIVGTILQVGLTVAISFGLGAALKWPFARSLLIGFVISLSSTAVLLKVLKDRGELHTGLGQDIAGVLLMQDVLVVPMLIALGLATDRRLDLGTLARQLPVGLGILLLLVYLAKRPSKDAVLLPFGSYLKEDHELQVFGAFLLCFGLGLITGLAELSVALGAFLAGIVVGAARETNWVHEALYPLLVLLLAAFFVSVGMMLDLRFLMKNAVVIALVLLVTLATNTLINALIFKALERPLGDALYGGAMLAGIGEFSFVLAAVGREAKIINSYGYQVIISVIALSLLLSPALMGIGRRLKRFEPQPK